MKKKKSIEFGIVGLGTFGFNLAKKLAGAGKEVLVIDQDEYKVDAIKNYVYEALIVKSLDKEVLEETGIQNCETVIICISKDTSISVLTTLNILNMEVPRVLAKANSNEHGAILERIGAEVIYPERDMADRIGGMLINSRSLDFIKLNGNVSITEFRIPSNLVGKSLKELGLREKYSLNIIALENENETTTNVNPEHIFEEEDYVVVVGSDEHIKTFENEYLNNN